MTQETTPDLYASNRDCGFSTKIGTDAYGQETHLWVFCDTPLHRRATPSSPYVTLSGGLFQTNTAGLTFYNPWASSPAAQIQKTRTSLTVRMNGGSYSWTEFVPRPTLSSCDGYSAAWPGSAVLLPGESNALLLDNPSKPATAVVLIFFQNICVHQDQSVTRHGSGVAAFQWSSNASDDPQQQFSVPSANPAYNLGLRATVISRTLFQTPTNDSGFQYGATLEDLGAYGRWLRVLRCHDKDFWHPELQPKVGCELAQVQITGNWQQDQARIANIDNWRYLRDPYSTSNAWKAFSKDASGAGVSPADAYDLTRSGTVTTSASGQVSYPATTPNGHTSLVYSSAKSLWVMISMIWGYDSKVVVYTAASLTGPWSAAKVLTLPAPCTTGSGCYAPSFHGELNGTSSLGFSYVDNDGLTVQSGSGVSSKVQLMRYGSIPIDQLPTP